MRSYLTEFLTDPRVIESQTIAWKLLLHTVILNIRPRRSAQRYQRIWMDQGSPLLIHSKKLAQALQDYLGESYRVVLGMRYGTPSIFDALEQIRQQDLDALIVLPLYPQYCAATVASCFDTIANALKTWRRIPPLRFISGYGSYVPYINALVEQINKYRTSEYLLFSYHGLPQKICDRGDPYQKQCTRTTELLAETLQLKPDHYRQVFQSRFGFKKWLQPYADRTLIHLAKKGIDRVDLICPGFTVDCLETLEEITQNYKKLFLNSGGKQFTYIPALNDQKEQVSMLATLIQSGGSRV